MRSLDDVRELQPLLVGYTGGDLTEALRRACPTARVHRLKDKRYRLTPD
ncbi:hypothetical protein [Saccharothrix mutabilis]